jgi:transcriptional regulator with XRE-family HTH domain
MDYIGQKIAALRKQQGYSQEALALLAAVNLRTVQRIETGASNPRGDTLRRISDALKVPTEALYEDQLIDNPASLRWMYLSVLSMCLIPLGNLIFPLIIWSQQRYRIRHLHQHGVHLLNFQFSLVIAWALMCYLGMYLRYMAGAPDAGLIILLSGFALLLLNLLYAVWVALRVVHAPEKRYYAGIAFFKS